MLRRLLSPQQTTRGSPGTRGIILVIALAVGIVFAGLALGLPRAGPAHAANNVGPIAGITDVQPDGVAITVDDESGAGGSLTDASLDIAAQIEQRIVGSASMTIIDDAVPTCVLTCSYLDVITRDPAQDITGVDTTMVDDGIQGEVAISSATEPSQQYLGLPMSTFLVLAAVALIVVVMTVSLIMRRSAQGRVTQHPS